MSVFGDLYLQQEYSGIVRTDWDSHEETGGYQDETYTEEVVARTAEGQFVRVRSKRIQRFGPRAGAPEESMVESAISEEEYTRIRAAATRIIDTPEMRAKFDQKKALSLEKQQARQALLQAAPRCPKHNLKMKLHPKGRFGPFWSCPKWSRECNATQDLTTGQRELLQQSGRSAN